MADYCYVSVTGRIADIPEVLYSSSGKPRLRFQLKTESPNSDGDEISFTVILYDEASEIDLRKYYEISITQGKFLIKKEGPMIKVRGEDRQNVRVLHEFDMGTISADDILKK